MLGFLRILAMIGIIAAVIALTQYTPQENSSRACATLEEVSEPSASEETASQTKQIQEDSALPESPLQEEVY